MANPVEATTWGWRGTSRCAMVGQLTSGNDSPSELAQGKYRIVEPLKTGGTAAIYLALMRGENNFSREVVIKRPLPHLLADPRLRTMFVDEAHIASRLAHPNVVQVIDLVANEEDVFLVLEYLRGRDLREVLRRSADLGRLLPRELVAFIGAEVCAGLDYAHDATAPDGALLNLVHRDVSPKNIRLTDRGVVKVIDFGIAHATHRTTETAPGSVKGTLGYMSPEQVMGESIDRRSDIFSFGICLFQMLTGRNPFDAPTLRERIHRLIHSPSPSVRDFDPSIDPRLDRVVRRCLERDLELRYQRMGEVESELHAYLVDQKIASPRQRLVELLETLFPDIHQLPSRLQEVLSTMSGLTHRNSVVATASELISQRALPNTPGPDGLTSASAVSAAVPRDMASAGPPHRRSEPAVRLVTSEPPSPLEPESLGAWSAWAEPPGQNLSISDASGGQDRTWVPPRLSEGRPPTETQTRRLFRGGFLVLIVGLVAAAALVVYVIRLRGGPVTYLPIATAPLPPAVAPSTVAASLPVPVPAPAPTRVDRGLALPVPARNDPQAAQRRPEVHLEPRELLRTGLHLQQLRQLDDALLVYRLAYARSGDRVDAAIFRNLGLVHRELGEIEKVRACFNMYLLRRPTADDGDQIRQVLGGYPATRSVPCVASEEAATAEKVARRAGARLEGWAIEARRGS